MKDHKDPDDRTQEEKIRFAKFKRDVYHEVLGVIFGDSLTQRSYNGECVPCGDGKIRVLYPGIPVLSLDGEEACICTCTKAAMADVPCSSCLVTQNELHDLSPNRYFVPRTTQSMKAVYRNSLNHRFKKDANDLLQRYGLHQTEVCSIALFLNIY